MTEAPPHRVPSPIEFENLLARFINETLLKGAGSVDRDTRLFEDGYMNSLRILDLIAMVEKTLGSRVPDRAVRLANFRSIATIVHAFHPDAAASEPATASDRLLERRQDRSRFMPPIQALERRGDLTLLGPGRIALSGLALSVLEAVDDTVTRWAQSLGAPEHRYPDLIGRDVLERAGQASAIPGGALESVALAPAVCYHAYPELSGKMLRSEPALLTARGHCFREEGGNFAPLERLREFTMREIIVLGTREQVETVRQTLVRQVTSFADTLGLDYTVESATDPFFAAGDEGRRLMQQAGALKYELRLTLDATGRAIAAASFNHHSDFFGTRFDIHCPDGTIAHSGCIAFGLERWVLALFSQFGIDESTWPPSARAWLSESRDAPRGAGA